MDFQKKKKELKIEDSVVEKIVEDVKQYPDSYYRERSDRLGIKIGKIFIVFDKLKITRKKKQYKHPKRNPEKEAEFLLILNALIISDYLPIYLDETGVLDSVHRDYGYNFRGHGIEDTKDTTERKAYNVIGAYNGEHLLGVGYCEHSINGPTFLYWVENFLLPALAELGRKCVVILDNARFHKLPEIEEAIKAAGHVVLWLPPYSPHLNPIERVWAHFKRHRQALRSKGIESIKDFLSKEKRASFDLKKCKFERVEYENKRLSKV